MVTGTIEAVDIIVFILVLGGLIGVVKASGAFEAGLGRLTARSKGKEFFACLLRISLHDRRWHDLWT
ncbi:arginine/ornithine antiporter ArcD [Cutibacterium acnes JCM 18909]|nr:arginine/ornithine antiporter ArcD [Cutibacterium acnes JCM 18909]